MPGKKTNQKKNGRANDQWQESKRAANAANTQEWDEETKTWFKTGVKNDDSETTT